MLKVEPTYVKSKEGIIEEMILPDPYMWVSENKESIFFQNGEFYDGMGEEPMDVNDVPEWFWRITRDNYDATGRKKYGLILPEEVKVTKEEKLALTIEKEKSFWKCDEPGCGEMVLNNVKGFHIANHVNKRKRQEKKGEVENGENISTDVNGEPSLRQGS